MNRLTNRASAGGLLAAYSYTADGQRQTMIDASGTSSYIYDVRGRVCTNMTPQGTLYYQYDPNGNLTNMSSSTSGGTEVSYQFDALNRLTNVLDASLGTAVTNTAYTYDTVGNLHQMQFPNGMSNAYQYDSLNRLTSLTWVRGTNMASFSYQLGPTGNRTSLQEVMPGAMANRTTGTPQLRLMKYLNPWTSGHCDVTLRACFQAMQGDPQKMMALMAQLLGANVTGWDDEYAVHGWGNQWTVDSKGNWTMKKGEPFKGSWTDMDSWSDIWSGFSGAANWFAF